MKVEPGVLELLQPGSAVGSVLSRNRSRFVAGDYDIQVVVTNVGSSGEFTATVK